jgi:hypothetical protein
MNYLVNEEGINMKEYITDNQLGRNEAFRGVIRKVYQEFRQKTCHKTYYKSSSKADDDLHSRNALDQLYLIEGEEILTDFCYLTCDLIHPSDFGHIIMGQNLA